MKNFPAFNFRGLAHLQKYFNSEQYSNYGISFTTGRERQRLRQRERQRLRQRERQRLR